VARIVLPVTVSLLALTSAAMYLVWICRVRGRATRLAFLQAAERPNSDEAMIGSLSAPNDLGDDDFDLPFVSFGDIVSATNNFSEHNKLGQGGFGKVYKVTTVKFLQNYSTKKLYHCLLSIRTTKSCRACWTITKKLQLRGLVRVLDKEQRNSEMKCF
jgi:hypothetical protein